MSKHQYNPASETESEASGNYHIKTYGNMHITMNGLFVNKIMTFGILAKVLGMVLQDRTYIVYMYLQLKVALQTFFFTCLTDYTHNYCMTKSSAKLTYRKMNSFHASDGMAVIAMIGSTCQYLMPIHCDDKDLEIICQN